MLVVNDVVNIMAECQPFVHNRLVFRHDIDHVINPLNAELNPICHLLALLAGATIVVVSRLRVNDEHNGTIIVVLAKHEIAP